MKSLDYRKKEKHYKERAICKIDGYAKELKKLKC